MSPGLFAQPGAYGTQLPFGPELGQAGPGQQHYPQQQHPWGGQPNPFTQNQFSQSPFTANPYLQSAMFASSPIHNPLLNSFSFAGPAGPHNAAQQIVPALAQLAQLAQQISLQSAVTQQIGIALHQLAHQLAAQSLQGQQGGGQALFAGAGQPFGQGGPFLGNSGGQYYGQNPLAGATQGGYGGFSSPFQAWSANRQQTIQ
jgi:hypothetical protein